MSCMAMLWVGAAVGQVHPTLKYLVLIRKLLSNVAQSFSPANESANFRRVASLRKSRFQ